MLVCDARVDRLCVISWDMVRLEASANIWFQIRAGFVSVASEKAKAAFQQIWQENTLACSFGLQGCVSLPPHDKDQASAPFWCPGERVVLFAHVFFFSVFFCWLADMFWGLWNHSCLVKDFCYSLLYFWHVFLKSEFFFASIFLVCGHLLCHIIKRQQSVTANPLTAVKGRVVTWLWLTF